MAVPTVGTYPATQVNFEAAFGNGSITDIGVGNATIRGFCYMVGTVGDPALDDDSEVHEDGDFGAGDFFVLIAGLSADQDYRVRAYATNTDGIGYGDSVQIHTTVDADKVPDTTGTKIISPIIVQ